MSVLVHYAAVIKDGPNKGMLACGASNTTSHSSGRIEQVTCNKCMDLIKTNALWKSFPQQVRFTKS